MKALNCLSKESLNLLNRNRLLPQLVKAEIERNELLNIELDAELKSTIKKKFLEKSGIKNAEEELIWLKNNNVDVSDFEYFIFKEEKLKVYFESKFSNKAESHFLKRKKDLDIVIYSLIRVQDVHKANELYLRIIEEQANFSDLAFAYSEGIEKNTRGIIGPCPIGSAHPDLAQHIRSIKPGEVKPPILISGSYLIIRVENFMPAKLDNFMRAKMAKELYNSWLKEEARQSTKKLMEQKNVSVEKSNAQ